MHPSEVARSAIVLVVSIAIVALPVVAAGILMARVTHRRAAWLVGVAASILGLVLGFALLASEAAPALRASSIVGIAALAGVMILSGRLSIAGLVVIAASAPWASYAGSHLLDPVVAVRRVDVGVVLPPFLAGIAGMSVGIALIRFHRGYLARHPEARTPITPPTRAWNAASRVALGPTLAGFNLAMLAAGVVLIVGTQASVAVGHGRATIETLVVVVVGSIATGLAALLAWVLAWPPRSRRAFEAFAWLGESELDRFRALTGGAVAPSLSNMKRYVRNTAERPDDRWIRVEVLAAAGRIEAARDVAERIPDETPSGRAERANYLAYVDWLGGGSGDPTELRGMVAAIEPSPGDDRLKAEVALALAEVRSLVAAGDADPAAPLRAVRERIGRRGDGIMFAAARRIASGFLTVAATFVIVATLVDRVTAM